MAKIVASMDTETKELSLSVDGKDIPGVCYVHMCSESEYMPMNFTAEIDESEDDSDVKVKKMLMASKSGIEKMVISDPSVTKAISSLFTRK
jgi:hypothetical protein